MITVACVEWGNYLGRGAEYVSKLKAMVAKHLGSSHRFVCLTDDPGRHPGLTYDECDQLAVPNDSWPADRWCHGLVGWWAKLWLFARGRFTGRVLYLDLDSVIVGPLDELAASKGIIDLRGWGWDRDVYGSGVMVWDAGEHEEVLSQYTPSVPQRFEGDQDWITSLGGWDALPAPLVRSYRYHSVKAPPLGCSVVAFHGRPKPHELLPLHWAREHWR